MRNDTIETPTITITDLADVQAGDIVTADYMPMSHERGARIVGEASQTAAGGLIVGGHHLRFADGGYNTSLRFVSATREVPVWEPDEVLRDWIAGRIEDYLNSSEHAWNTAGTILTHMHDNGWLKDDPAESEPVDPVMDETDKRDRIDSDGDRWYWSEGNATWISNDDYAMGSLAALDRHYGPLTFADEEAEA